MGEDDPIIYLGKINSLDIYDRKDGNVVDWDMEFSANMDLQKIYFIIEGSGNKESNGDTETEAEIRLQYAHAISAYWDATLGLKQDYASEKSKAENTWLEFGFRGLAPYFIETNATVFLGEEGRSAFNIEMEKELMITQLWLLFSDLTLDFNGYNDNSDVVGSGLSDAELSLRLAYRVTRKFTPYVGLQYNHSFGNTKKIKENNNEDSHSSEVFVGLKLWF